METELGIIPARSRKQAMEWSLVLLSQEIESTIQPPTEEHGWQLLVKPADYPRATQALDLYRQENRSRRWRQELPLGGLVFDWRGIVWFVGIVAIYLLSNTSDDFRAGGRMDAAKVWSGQWWRLFTAVTLHADAGHLASNLMFGVLLLGLAMGSFGPGVALLASYLAGVGANLALIFIYPVDHLSLGASGMVMGSLGLLTGQSLALLRAGLSGGEMIVRGVIAGILLLVLLGLSPTSDVAAHVGGFVLGVLFGAVLGWFAPKLAQSNWTNRLCEALCALLLIWTWYLALH